MLKESKYFFLKLGSRRGGKEEWSPFIASKKLVSPQIPGSAYQLSQLQIINKSSRGTCFMLHICSVVYLFQQRIIFPFLFFFKYYTCFSLWNLNENPVHKAVWEIQSIPGDIIKSWQCWRWRWVSLESQQCNMLHVIVA